MVQDFSKFKFSEKFNSLPEKMHLNGRGHLCLEKTEVDMIPAGLKGVTFVHFTKKPLYIAPDFTGYVCYPSPDGLYPITMMPEEVIKAKHNYHENWELVEKPRYNENGKLCSLPTDIHITYDLGVGYCLDLRRTSVPESEQKIGGFKKIIFSPKIAVQPEFDFIGRLRLDEAKKIEDILLCALATRAGRTAGLE